MRIVIIGGEAAGMSAAAKARRLAKDADIVVYEASEVISFGACGLPYFVVGMAIGMLYLRWQAPARWRHHGFVAALGLLLLLYPAIFERLTGWSYGQGGGESPMWFLPLLLLAMSAIFFALVFLVPDGNPVLEHRLGDYLGNISYSMYLLHFPILLAMEQFGLARGAGGLLLFLALTMLASTLTYRFFERPMRLRIRGQEAPGT